MNKIKLNISGNLADWPPLAVLITIYFTFFIRHKAAINEGIAKDYEKEIDKIESSFIDKGQTLSPLKRVPPLENILTMYGHGQKARRKHAFRRNFIKVLDGSFFIAFGIFGCRILFTILNFFSSFLPFMYLAGICFTLAVIVMTCIIARFPRI